MGRVLLVEHVLMQTRHAIKVLHDQLSKNEMIVQRFLNEARAAGAIGHRNVVEITHVDQVEGGGAWYLVMKYLEGRTLASFLEARSAPIEQRLIVHIVGEALNGLQAAHDRRIIHRDLKPDNLYLTSVKDDPFRTIILDFGVAQLGQEAGVITRTGALIGTPQYMAPEQHRSRPIDHRTDVWAMGAIVYEMATGRLPYQYDGAERGFLTGPEIFHRMMTHPVVDPRQYNPAITEGFARATLMALALDPARRPDSARALAVMLAEATPGDSHAPSGIEILNTYADELLEGGASRQLTPPATIAGSGRQRRVAVQVAAPAAMSTLGATASQSFPTAKDPGVSRRPRRSVVAIACGVLAAAVTGIVLWSRHEAPGTPGTANPYAQPIAAPSDAMIANVPVQDVSGVVAVTGGDSTTADAATEIAKTRPATGRLSPEGEAAGERVGATVAADANDPRVGTIVDVDAGSPRVEATITAGANGPRVGTTAAPDKNGRRAAAAAATDTDVTHARAATVVDAGTGEASGLAVYPRDAGLPDTAAVNVGRAEPVATGKLNVIILPWAEVWVDGRPLGQTPVTTKLSVGTHRVRLKNDTTAKTVTVTVTSGKTTVIDQTW
jgi:serine/threonine-protein kinase